jgi:hypothetical protein
MDRGIRRLNVLQTGLQTGLARLAVGVQPIPQRFEARWRGGDGQSRSKARKKQTSAV